MPGSSFVESLKQSVFGVHVLNDGLHHQVTAVSRRLGIQSVVDTTQSGGQELLPSLTNTHIL